MIRQNNTQTPFKPVPYIYKKKIILLSSLFIFVISLAKINTSITNKTEF